jgi:hypothetical protein
MSGCLFKRAAAALALAVVGASLALFVRPVSAATTGISAIVKYGCNDGGWVEVTLNPQGGEDPARYQVGLTADGSDTPDSQYAQGGPGMVVSDGGKTTIRLAGLVRAGDKVFVRNLYTGASTVLPLPQGCSNSPTNFGLSKPTLDRTLSPSCISNSAAKVVVDVTNPNDLDNRTENAGLVEIDYTVLLVRADDGTLMSSTGELFSFPEPGRDSVDLSMPAARSTNYEVRVISVDGTVSTRAFSADCAQVTTPPPTTTPPPPPTTTPVATPTPTPTVKSPPPSSPGTPKPHPSSSRSQGSTGSQPGSTNSSGAGPTVGSGTVRVRGSAAGASGFAIPPLGPSSSTAHRSSPPASSPSSAVPDPSPSPSATKRLTLADPARGTGSLLVWHSDAALIVGVDALAISALVGATVWRTRRR